MKRHPFVVKIMSDGETKLYNLGKLKRLIDQSLKEDRFYQKPGYYFKPDWDEEQLSKREKSWL
jgi:hypothetical protein